MTTCFTFDILFHIFTFVMLFSLSPLPHLRQKWCCLVLPSCQCGGEEYQIYSEKVIDNFDIYFIMYSWVTCVMCALWLDFARSRSLFLKFYACWLPIKPMSRHYKFLCFLQVFTTTELSVNSQDYTQPPSFHTIANFYEITRRSCIHKFSPNSQTFTHQPSLHLITSPFPYHYIFTQITKLPYKSACFLSPLCFWKMTDMAAFVWASLLFSDLHKSSDIYCTNQKPETKGKKALSEFIVPWVKSSQCKKNEKQGKLMKHFVTWCCNW